MKNYISNGRVSREEIAADIRDGILSRDDIHQLVAIPEIKKAFIGASYSKKVSPEKWTKEYLDKLPNAAVAEAFNEDYMYYLADVSEYVNRQADEKGASIIFKKLWPIILVAAAAIVVIGCIVYFTANSSK